MRTERPDFAQAERLRMGLLRNTILLGSEHYALGTRRVRIVRTLVLGTLRVGNNATLLGTRKVGHTKVSRRYEYIAPDLDTYDKKQEKVWGGGRPPTHPGVPWLICGPIGRKLRFVGFL